MSGGGDGWRGRYEESVAWFFNAEVPLLAAGEQVEFSTIASLVAGAWPSRGRLLLTTHRLIYLPWHARFVPTWPFRWRRVEVGLSEVAAVGRGSWVRGLWGGFPGFPVLTVTLTDGTVYRFQTLLPGYVRRAIETVMREQAG